MRIAIACTVSIALLVAAGPAAAFNDAKPANGQSRLQQDKDTRDCNFWAYDKTGFDPATPAPTPEAPQQKRGGVLKGAVIGGAAGGLIDDNGGEGAVVGGLIGGIRQGSKNQQSRAQSESDYRQRMEWHEQGKAAYDRAWKTCMEQRGYTT
jgi:hypothetical protein